jgi:NADP-dependent 3-hydroxy acid dehydrogenase YdfG
MVEAERIAVVTGATSGIGNAIARELATLGYAVMLTGRNEARGAARRVELEERGARVSAWYGDLGADRAHDHA